MLFAVGEYAELLGFYLGDGDISRVGRSYRLRISLDAKYPRIIERARQLVERGLFMHSVGTLHRHEGRMEVVAVYSSHLPCLFPQHGAGPTVARSASTGGRASRP